MLIYPLRSLDVAKMFHYPESLIPALVIFRSVIMISWAPK